MKRIRNFVVIVLAVCLVLAMSSIAFAVEAPTTESGAQAEQVFPDVEKVEAPEEIQLVDPSTLDDSIELTVGEAGDQISLEGTSSDVDSETAAVQNLVDSSSYEEMNMVVNPNLRSSYNAFYGSETDSIATEGTIQPYGVFKLAPNQILQAGLVCPDNVSMDYDLYIAAVNADNTVGDILTASQYTTNIDNTTPKTLDEGTDYINTTSQTQSYCILVHAKTGGSTMFPYTLYYSIDAPGNYNSGESDQNAATPCGTMSPGQNVSNVILNSPADVDWFAININIGTAYNWADIGFTLTDPSTGATISTDSVELYNHIGNNKMSLIPKNGNSYRFTPRNAQYYLKITAKDRNNFDWHTYKLSANVTATQAKPATIEITKLSTDQDRDGNNYVDYPQLGNAYIVFTKGAYGWLEVSGIVKDQFGNPCSNAYMTVDGQFTNLYWANEGKNDSLAYRYDTTVTGSNGAFTLQFNEMPSPSGRYTYHNPYSGLTHYYDLAQISITAGDISGTLDVYHEAYGIL